MESELTDAELVQAIAAGANVAAEAALYRRFARRIERYGLRHLRDAAAAEDLVQQVIVRVLTSIREGRLKQPTRLASFVLGTCRNVTWDTGRAELRQRAIERQVSVFDDTVGPPGVTESDVRQLIDCVGRLPEREALIVRLTYKRWRACTAVPMRATAAHCCESMRFDSEIDESTRYASGSQTW